MARITKVALARINRRSGTSFAPAGDFRSRRDRFEEVRAWWEKEGRRKFGGD